MKIYSDKFLGVQKIDGSKVFVGLVEAEVSSARVKFEYYSPIKLLVNKHKNRNLTLKLALAMAENIISQLPKPKDDTKKLKAQIKELIAEKKDLLTAIEILEKTD